MRAEDNLQIVMVKWLRDALPEGSLVFAIKNEQMRASGDEDGWGRGAAALGAYRKSLGVLAGVFDLCCIVRWYPPIFIENKAPGKDLSDTQKHFEATAREAGCWTIRARSIQDVYSALMSEGPPLRTTPQQVTYLDLKIAERQAKPPKRPERAPRVRTKLVPMSVVARARRRGITI